MTTYHEDPVEGFWFSLIAAFSPDEEIDRVVILNLTEAVDYPKYQKLLKKINSGWVPSD